MPGPLGIALNNLEMGGGVVLPVEMDFASLSTFANEWSAATWIIEGGYAKNAPTKGLNLLADAGFETWADGTHLTSWDEGSAGTSTVNQDTDGKRGGTYCARMDIDASNSNAYVAALEAVTAHKYYELGAYFKNTGAASKSAKITVESTTRVIPLTATYAARRAVAYSADTTLTNLFGRNSAASDSIYVDDAWLYQLTTSTLFATRQTNWTDVDVVVRSSTPSGIPVGAILRADAAAPTAGILVYYDGVKVFVDQMSGSQVANVNSWAVTAVAGAALDIRLSGATVTIYYNGAAVGSETVTIMTGNRHGMMSGNAELGIAYFGMAKHGATWYRSLYVDGTNGNNTYDGKTAATAVQTIAQANTLAGTRGEINRILIAAGTYAETVTPPRGMLRYEGLGDVIVDPSGAAKGFAVTKPNVTITQMTVTGATVGIEYDGATGGMVSNCTVHTCSDIGIYFKASSNLGAVSNCIVHTIVGAGIGITLYNSTGSVSDCTVYNCDVRGIYLYNCPAGTVTDCYGHTPSLITGYCFEAEAASDAATFTNCWATDAKHGFISKTSDGVIFDNCVAWSNTDYGFYCKAGVNTVIRNCVSFANAIGVELSDNAGVAPASTGANLRDNVIADNTSYGIQSADGSNVGLDSDYNDFNGNTKAGDYETTDCTALSDWQTAATQDAHSVTTDPAYASEDYGGFVLTADSTLRTAGSTGGVIGREP